MTNSVRSRTDVLIDFASSTGPLVSSAWMGTVLISFGLFLTHTGEFTRFLHCIRGAYLLFSLWTLYHGSFFRSSSSFEYSALERIQEDSVIFRLFFLYSTLIVMIFFFGRSTRFVLSKRTPREFPALVFFIHLGGLFLLKFSTFIDLLLALEMVTLASYVLVSFERQNRFSTYAGIQYFLVGSIPSASLLLGFSFFYLYGGTLVIQDLDLRLNSFEFYSKSHSYPLFQESSILFNSFFDDSSANNVGVTVFDRQNSISEIQSQNYFAVNEIESLVSSRIPYTTLSLRGFLFMFFNLLFKITAAPFHFWAPSVYGKAPISSVTFLSIYSKVRVFFFMYTLLTGFLHYAATTVLFLFIIAGLLSVLVGRIGAFTEKRIKRFFVFSSRGHVGFRLAGFALSSAEGFSAVFHYLPVYRLSSFLRWYILFSRGKEYTYLTQFASLKLQQPLLAVFFAFLLFSRSGIPPFAGFFVKLDILAALFDSSHFFVNYVFLFFTVGSFFYYLRAVKILFFDQIVKSNLPEPISFNSTFSSETPRSERQYWLRSSIFLFLLFYIFFVQKPLFIIQNERLFSRLVNRSNLRAFDIQGMVYNIFI